MLTVENATGMEAPGIVQRGKTAGLFLFLASSLSVLTHCPFSHFITLTHAFPST